MIFETTRDYKPQILRLRKILLIRDMVDERCNRRFDRETIHPTHKKYFYEFVANVLRDNIGILIFGLHGGC